MSELHYNEIKLSRELMQAIEEALRLDPASIPDNVRIAYNKLYGEYIRQQQSEVYIP